MSAKQRYCKSIALFSMDIKVLLSLLIGCNCHSEGWLIPDSCLNTSHLLLRPVLAKANHNICVRCLCLGNACVSQLRTQSLRERFSLASGHGIMTREHTHPRHTRKHTRISRTKTANKSGEWEVWWPCVLSEGLTKVTTKWLTPMADTEINAYQWRVLFFQIREAQTGRSIIIPFKWFNSAFRVMSCHAHCHFYEYFLFYWNYSVVLFVCWIGIQIIQLNNFCCI